MQSCFTIKAVSDELSREFLAPERLEEMRAEELEKLREEIEALVTEINRREWRDMMRSLNQPFQAPTVDPAVPLMRNRLVQRRAKLVEILDSTVALPGMEDEGLAKEKPEDRAVLAAQDVVIALVRKRALPVEDPLISEDEIEEEHERQTGSGSADPGPSRRRGVRSR